MKPPARIQAVIDILDGLNATAQPADRYLRDWGRTHRFAGSKDRASIGERVFTIFRHRAAFSWRMQSERPRALAIASLLHEGFDEAALENIFNGENYAPPKLSEEERASVLVPPKDSPPLHVQGEFPEWLQGKLSERFGESLLPEMRALVERAPVDLRANTLKISRDALLYQLRNEYEGASATPYSPLGIRIPQSEASAALGKSEAFENGLFEFQDEAAQIASLLCGARPGMRVLDSAAGAGGKSLALAAAMENKGEIVARDIRPDALARLAGRAARAGVTIIHNDLGSAPFDLVLVDAPCSGSGTWRRQPELKWRLTPNRLEQFTKTQDQLLAEAASSLKPGGRLVYATCSVLPCENEGRIAAFLEAHSGFSLVPAARLWRDITSQESPPGMGEFFRASPYLTGTDGFFAAVLAGQG